MINKAEVIQFIEEWYQIDVARLLLLPLGADSKTAVYHLQTKKGEDYFLKVRDGSFHYHAILIPQFLAEHGVEQIIPPILGKDDSIWGNFGSYELLLYPFIEGENGYRAQLQEKHWAQFGAALKRIHTAEIPSSLIGGVRREDYSDSGRKLVKEYLGRVGNEQFIDPIGNRTALFLQSKETEIFDLLARADRLAQHLQEKEPQGVICHGDLHAGNLMLVGDRLYIVDWDQLIFAPKERDLMFIGGGLLNSKLTVAEEIDLFYPSYREVELNEVALAYYRYERIIQDIAVYAEELLLVHGTEADREEGFTYLQSNFLPGNTIEIAYYSDKSGGKR